MVAGAAGLGLQHPRQELLLAHHDVSTGVAELVRDLRRGIGVVHREWDRTQVVHRGVHEVELGTVREHDRHRVALAHTESRQAPGEPADVLGVLAPGVGERAVDRAQSELVGVRGGGLLEQLAERRGLLEAGCGVRRVHANDCAAGHDDDACAGRYKFPDERCADWCAVG